MSPTPRRQVTAPVPAVQHAVQAVAPVVPKTLTAVAAAKPVEHIVTPVATAVDTVVNSVPAVTAVTGKSPVSTVTAPVVSTVDTTVDSLGSGAASSLPTVPVTGPGSGTSPVLGVTSHLYPAPTVLRSSFVPTASSSATAASAQAAVDRLDTSFFTANPLGAFTARGTSSLSTTAAVPGSSTPASPAAPAPTSPASPDRSPALPGGSIGGTAGAGSAGASGTTTAVTGDAFVRPALLQLSTGAGKRVIVPAAPTFDSDTTPD